MRKTFVPSLGVLALLAGCATAPAEKPAESPVTAVLAETNYDHLIQLGDAAYRAGDFDLALFNYVKAAKADESAELPYLRMAVVHDERKDQVQLRQALQEALARNPRNAAAHEHLGFAHLRLGDPEAASASFTEAAGLDEKRWRAVMGLGLAAMARSDLWAARLHFDTARRMQPRSAELLAYSAELHLRAGTYDKGVEDARASLEITPTPSAWIVLGDLLVRSGDYPGGFEAYMSALKEPAAYQRLGEEAMRAQDYERALRYFSQAAAASPTYDEHVQKRIAVARERLAESRRQAAKVAGG